VTLDLNQITAILGERPFAPKAAFKAYLETKKDIEETNKKESEGEVKKEEPKEEEEKPKESTTTI